jgi:hypothetical protein
MSTNLDDLEHVLLPPGIERGDFDGSEAMDLTASWVAVHFAGKRLGAVYHRASKTWSMTHPVDEREFAQGIAPLLAADQAAADEAAAALARMRH